MYIIALGTFGLRFRIIYVLTTVFCKMVDNNKFEINTVWSKCNELSIYYIGIYFIYIYDNAFAEKSL